MRTDEALFWKYDWHRVVDSQRIRLTKEVNKLDRRAFETSSLAELTSKLVAELSLEPPKIDEANVEVSQREVDIEVRDAYDRGIRHRKGTEIEVRIPFAGDPEMFYVRPTTYTNPPHGRISGSAIVFTVSGTNLTPEFVKGEIENRVQAIKEFLEYQQKSVGSYPEDIRRLANQSLEQRRDKLSADANLVSSLGYKLK